MGRAATLDDIPDAELDRLAEMGFDWVWFLSVWQTGLAGQRISRSNPEWRREFQETLPDLCEEDIPGSGFAITGYTVHSNLGGDAALARLRERLRKRGLRLMLDFVPNHTGLDHPWVEDHPEYYIRGNRSGPRPSTAELHLGQASGWRPAPRSRARSVLRRLAGHAAAQLRQPGHAGSHDRRALQESPGSATACAATWPCWCCPTSLSGPGACGLQPFWPQATRCVREQVPDFCFMAEVYWDLEWTLQQQGFDYTYDKRLYDRLREGHARPVREHFCAGLDYQNKMARFLENHDEPRAAAAFSPEVHEAAAVITFLSPGLRFFHQGQFEGRKKRISPHLGRGPCEASRSAAASQFYERLLAVLREPAVRDGQWQLLECVPAWEGNWTWDCFVAFAWQGPGAERLLVAVNYAPNQSQCYVRLPLADLAGSRWRLQDQLSSAVYDRDGNDLQSQGLFLDMSPWQTAVYSLTQET